MTHVFDPSKGHARFEVLGMLDDYMGRLLGRGNFIERFYPSQKVQADRFEQLLNELCAEDHLPKHWQRKKQKEGHITFTGMEIAKAINRNFEAYDDGFYTRSSIGPTGRLSSAVFQSASQADLLRYIAGAQTRFGSSTHQAIFIGANCGNKFELLADVLARLGCSNIRLYCTQELVPTTYILLFSPSLNVQERTGMRHEVTSAEIKERYSKGNLMRVPFHP